MLSLYVDDKYSGRYIYFHFCSLYLSPSRHPRSVVCSDMKLACCAIWCRLWELIFVLDKNFRVNMTQCDTILNALKLENLS